MIRHAYTPHRVPGKEHQSLDGKKPVHHIQKQTPVVKQKHPVKQTQQAKPVNKVISNGHVKKMTLPAQTNLVETNSKPVEPQPAAKKKVKATNPSAETKAPTKANSMNNNTTTYNKPAKPAQKSNSYVPKKQVNPHTSMKANSVKNVSKPVTAGRGSRR
jgi:hypothetical protein